MSASSKKLLSATRKEAGGIGWFTFLPDTYVDGLEKRPAFCDIAFDPDGSIYLCGGYFTDNNPTYFFEQVFDGAVVVKLNADRSLAWAKYIPGTYYSANCIQYMNPYGTKPCVVIGFDYWNTVSNVISLMSLDTIDGSIINQLKISESASSYAMKVMDMKPIQSSYDSNNASLLCVGQNYYTPQAQFVAYSATVVLDGSGVISAPNSPQALWSSTYNNPIVAHRLALNTYMNEWFVVGRNEQSSLYEMIGSGNSTSATPIINIGRLFRYSDYINGNGMSDVVCDSSGYTYLAHSSGQITKIFSASAAFTTTTWRVALNSNSAYKSPVCLALTADENYLYVANAKNLISKIATSDGSVVAEMAIPCPQMGYRNSDHVGRYKDKEGFKQIKVVNETIYLLLNYPVKSWASHGSLLIIPESEFGTEFKLENGVALLNADNLATATALSTAAPLAFTLASASLTGATSAPTYSVSDLITTLNSEEANDAAPVFIYGINYGEAGESYTFQALKPLMVWDTYGTYTFSAQENDISLYHYSRSSASATSPSYSEFRTDTPDYSYVSAATRNNTYSTLSLVEWKRMGVTPDTNIYIPYSQDASAGVTYRVILIRGLPTAGVPYSAVGTQGSTSSYDPFVGPVSVASESLVLSYGVNSSNGQRISGASKSSWTEFSTASPEVSFGSDTYDSASIFAAAYVESAGTFSVSSRMKGYSTDNTGYSTGTNTIVFPW